MRLFSRLVRAPRAEPVNLEDPATLADPFSAYERMRREGPVHFLPHHGFWLVLSYQGVKSAFERPDLFSNAPYANIDAVLLAADPPQQPEVRRLVGRFLSPAVLADLTALAAETAAARLHGTLDLVEDYSFAVSRAVGGALLGWDAATVAEVVAETERARAAPDAVQALIEALDRLADRAALFSRLREQAEGRLEEAALRSLVRLLWLASTSTTERVITRAALVLLQRPDLTAALLADRSLVGALLEEVMRLWPPELMVPRRTLARAVVAGDEIPAGAEVRLCIAAANRDPAHFEDPAEIRLGRAPKQHFAFGAGIHKCLGTTLARRVAGAAVEALLDRIAELSPAEPLDRLEWFATPTALAPRRLLCTVG